ncbi:MAG: phosphoribosylaminoimidazolesuccinocarboxamide synthase [Patescibacteria group bacterium]|nr:phosphoribosylaminoimidazolesuccinocarboxamide synthase [Patescibacteria group bacterium]
MKYEKAKLIIDGKTKSIFVVKGDDNLVVIENKDDITAFDDSTFTKEFASKGEHATTTTCRVFELLQAAGISVAYKGQISPTEFVADRCAMIQLEVVARRLAVGSFLKRHPELTPKKGQAPHRFHKLVVEFFLKTTGGKLISNNRDILLAGLRHIVDGKTKTLDDPFIINPFEEEWQLAHPKKPDWENESNLEKTVIRELVVPSDANLRMSDMETMMRQVFLILEGAWNTLGLRIIDMKIEFGINPNGKLLVSDVIDNDSWRLRTHDWLELSKQAFRDGESLSEVEKKYGTVAKLTERFRIPNQALILWRGSDKDPWPVFDSKLKELISSIEKITFSGHKSPVQYIDILEKLMAKYPDGGVIVAKVGRSNGLGPLLAARTSWPVIAIPATADKFPEDIWSSVRMPSEVPLSTSWPEGNAIGQAVNILSQKNPALYMWNQKYIENLGR